MQDFITNADKLIQEKRFQISKLQDEIKQLCFDCIQKQKDVKVGDLIYIPSKNKYGIFIDLHNEDVNNQILKSNLLTKQGLPSKNITTVSLNDLEKVTETLEYIITTNFSGEEFDANKAISACNELINKLNA